MRYNEDKIISELLAYVQKTYTEHYVKGDGTEKDIIQYLDTIFQKGNNRGTHFCVDTAGKYLNRYGEKEGYNRKDLLKALHYIVLALYNHDKDNVVPVPVKEEEPKVPGTDKTAKEFWDDYHKTKPVVPSPWLPHTPKPYNPWQPDATPKPPSPWIFPEQPPLKPLTPYWTSNTNSLDEPRKVFYMEVNEKTTDEEILDILLKARDEAETDKI